MRNYAHPMVVNDGASTLATLVSSNLIRLLEKQVCDGWPRVKIGFDSVHDLSVAAESKSVIG